MWEDTDDEWTEAIKAAHPARSESHDEYGVAMQMVGHRHSKGELVALVNWLLVLLKRTDVTLDQSESESKDEVSRLRVQVDELTAQRDAFGQKANQLQERVAAPEVCTHGNGNPNACPECTKALVMADPVARAAYWQNRAERREAERDAACSAVRILKTVVEGVVEQKLEALRTGLDALGPETTK